MQTARRRCSIIPSAASPGRMWTTFIPTRIWSTRRRWCSTSPPRTRSRTGATSGNLRRRADCPPMTSPSSSPRARLPSSSRRPRIPPARSEDSANANAAVRFLTQATFGAGASDIAAVQSLGYAGWISHQFALPATHALPTVFANRSADPSNPWPSSDWFNTWWQNSVTAPDQLRQRVAFALSEIMVASESGTLQDHADALAYYYDTLLDHAFGNFRALLEAVTLTPAMGVYLNMQGNDKGNLVTGTHANENYAREINQLFSIGLNRMWPDGSLILNSAGNLVPTHNQNVINGFGPPVNYTNPMVLVPAHHDLNAKLLLNNIVLP